MPDSSSRFHPVMWVAHFLFHVKYIEKYRAISNTAPAAKGLKNPRSRPGLPANPQFARSLERRRGEQQRGPWLVQSAEFWTLRKEAALGFPEEQRAVGGRGFIRWRAQVSPCRDLMFDLGLLLSQSRNERLLWGRPKKCLTWKVVPLNKLQRLRSDHVWRSPKQLFH